MALGDYERIIIHAGLHKTGTSYIQKLLHVNRDRLAEAGIHFPQYHDGPKRRESGNHSRAVKDCDNRTEPLDDILGEWLDVDSRCPVLVLSAEALANRIPMNRRFARELAALAATRDVHIVYYLRRQDHLVESLFGEMVKKHDLSSPTEVNYAFDYLELAQSIEKAVPKARISFRPYNGKRWKLQNLGAEFFDAIEYPELWDRLETKEIARENERLDRRQIFLLATAATPQEKRQRMKVFRNLPKEVAEGDHGFFLSPAERKDFLLQYAESNEQLAERYGLGDWKDFLGVDLNEFAREEWRRFDTDPTTCGQYMAELEQKVGKPRNRWRSLNEPDRLPGQLRARQAPARNESKLRNSNG